MRNALAVAAVALVALALEARPAAAVTCTPDQALVVLEARAADRLQVAHVEFPGCVGFPLVQGMAWTVERCTAKECTPFPFRHPRLACPGGGCFDQARAIVSPRGAGLYVFRLKVTRTDGVELEGGALVRVGRRPLAQ